MNKKSWNLAISGESMVTRRFSMYDEPGFLSLMRNFQDADISFTHLEMLLHEQVTAPGKAEYTGGYMGGDPRIADDLAWAGFNVVSCAHNHAGDFGEIGMKETMRHLDRTGIMFAGIGPGLERAREPGYLENARGRVALISVSSGHDPNEAAGASTGIIPGRTGLNPLRYSTRFVVDSDSFARLQQLSTGLSSLPPLAQPRGLSLKENEVHFLERFVRGEKMTIETTPNPADMEANLRAVRDAARQADFVIVSHHCHAPTADPDRPATLVEPFAKAAIDAGADLYVGHGPHRDLGIEVYEGKPIFYGLGNFFAQSQFLRRIPADGYEVYGFDMDRLPALSPADYHDARKGILPPDYPSGAPHPLWWESTFATMRIENGRLAQLSLHPVTLGYGDPGPARKAGIRVEGWPVLAPRENGERILQRIARLSVDYGTRLQLEDGVGRVSLDA